MAGDVVNWTFYLASTFVVYWQFCAPKSATAPSAKPLCGSLKKDDTKPKNHLDNHPTLNYEGWNFSGTTSSISKKQFNHWLGDKQTIWALRFKPNFSEIDLTWLFLKIDFKAVFTDKSGFSNRQEINAKYLALNLKSKISVFF